MQNTIDTRLLKKFSIYMVYGILIISGAFGSLLGLMILSYYLFDSAVPFGFLLSFVGLTGCVYLMAKDKVESERFNEQRLVDELRRNYERQEEIAKINEKYGTTLT